MRVEGRRSLAGVVIAALLFLSGCDEQLGLPGDGQNNPAPVHVMNRSAPSADQVQLENRSGPPSSGMPFTLWDAEYNGHQITFKYRYEGDRSPGQSFRIVVNAGSETYHANVNPYVSATSESRGSVSIIGRPITATDASMYIESYRGVFGRDGATPVSNTVTVKLPDRGPPVDPANTGTAGNANVPQKGPGLRPEIDRAWHKMAKDIAEDKLIVINLKGIEKLDVSTKFVELAQELCDNGMTSSVVTGDGFAAAILGPFEDMTALAGKIQFGHVEGVDTSRRIIHVAVNQDLFGKNRKGIATDPSHPDYFRVNLELITTKDTFARMRPERNEAIRRLKDEDPNKCTDKTTRHAIARAYKDLLGEDHMKTDTRRDAVEGLANWGGKYSVPILIEMLQRGNDFFSSDRDLQETVVRLLGDSKDPKALPPLVQLFGDTTFGIKPVKKSVIAEAIAKIGPAGEQSMIDLAPSNDPEVSMLSIQTLGEIGTEKSLPILRKAKQSRNVQVREQAQRSMDKISERMRAAKAKGKE